MHVCKCMWVGVNVDVHVDRIHTMLRRSSRHTSWWVGVVVIVVFAVVIIVFDVACGSVVVSL